MNKHNLNRIIPVKNEVENGFQCKVLPIVGSGGRASVENIEKGESSHSVLLQSFGCGKRARNKGGFISWSDHR